MSEEKKLIVEEVSPSQGFNTLPDENRANNQALNVENAFSIKMDDSKLGEYSKSTWLLVAIRFILCILFFIFTRPSNFQSETQCVTLLNYSVVFLYLNLVFIVINLLCYVFRHNLQVMCLSLLSSIIEGLIALVFIILLQIGYSKGESCGGLSTLVLIYLILFYTSMGILALVGICCCACLLSVK